VAAYPEASLLHTSTTRGAKTKTKRCDLIKSYDNSTQDECPYQTAGRSQYAGGGEVDMSARVSPVLDSAGTWLWASGTVLDP
jgi:hypothetical protein